MFGALLKTVSKFLGPAGIALDIVSSLMSQKSGGADSSSSASGGGIDFGQLQAARQKLQDQLGQVSVIRQQLNIGQNGSISISMSAQPLPFSVPAGSPMANAAKNPFDALGPLKELLTGLMPALGKMLQSLSGGGSSGGVSGGGSAAPASSSSYTNGSTGSSGGAESSAPASSAGSSGGIGGDSSGWGAIDGMMAEAEKLAKSKNPSDQLRAQQMMNQAQQMFQTISKLLQQLSDMFKTAMGNVK